MLENQLDFGDLEILDLCSGTGNIAFEFLSREAGRVTAVDNNFKAVQHIVKIAQEFGCSDEIDVLRADILKFLEKTDQTFDIIFADPPYGYANYAALPKIIFERGLLKPDGLLIIEHGKETQFEGYENFSLMRKFGNVQFSFFALN